jgi:hypothetical protein
MKQQEGELPIQRITPTPHDGIHELPECQCTIRRKTYDFIQPTPRSYDQSRSKTVQVEIASQK